MLSEEGQRGSKTNSALQIPGRAKLEERSKEKVAGIDGDL